MDACMNIAQADGKAVKLSAEQVERVIKLFPAEARSSDFGVAAMQTMGKCLEPAPITVRDCQFWGDYTPECPKAKRKAAKARKKAKK